MMTGKPLKFLIIDELEEPQLPRWRHSHSRYGCDRSIYIVSRIPDQADRIARRTVEAGSPFTKKQNPTVTGGLQ